MDFELIKKFTENNKMLTEVNKHFIEFMDCDIITLERNKDKLISYNHNVIVKCLIKYDLDSFKSSKVGRIMTLLDYLDQNALVKYRTLFNEKYSEKKLGKKPEMDQFTKDKNIIKEFNDKLKAYNKEKNFIEDFNFKIASIIEALESLIIVDIYGDKNYNVDDKDFLYFKLYDYEQEDIDVFVQELRLIPTLTAKNIVTIRNEDITGNTPVAKKANEIRVYFVNDSDLVDVKKNIEPFNSVYAKFVMRNKLMFKIGGELGLNSERPDNINGLNLNNNSNPTPVSLNSGSYNEEKDWFAKDLEVSLSECVFYEVKKDVYAIVPKEFWEEFHTVLDNKFMKIDDNSVRRYDEIYYKADYQYLVENCLEEVDIDDVKKDNSEYIFAFCGELLISSKKYFKENGDIDSYEHEYISTFRLEENDDSTLTIFDENDEPITSKKKIYEILTSENFKYSKKLQKFVDKNFNIKKFLKKINKETIITSTYQDINNTEITYKLIDHKIEIITDGDLSDKILYGYSLLLTDYDNDLFHLYNPNNEIVELESEIDFILKASGLLKQ